MKTSTSIFKVCASWEEAKKKSVGYTVPELVRNLLTNFRENPPWLSVDVSNLDSRIMELVASFSLVTKGANNRVLNVVDLGGGNGYMGVYMQKLFPDIQWNWTVYESKEIANAYASVAKDSNIIDYKPLESFLNNIESEKIDIILMSCSLQYLEKPYSILGLLLETSMPKIISRIPFIDSNSDIITIQDLSKIGGYAGISKISWPAWWFSRSKFFNTITKKNKIIANWVTDSESYYFQDEQIPLEGLIIV